MPAIRVLVIDADSKDSEVARRVLRGEVENWDVVICTPVAQSGVSWTGHLPRRCLLRAGEHRRRTSVAARRVGEDRDHLQDVPKRHGTGRCRWGAGSRRSARNCAKLVSKRLI